MAQPKLLMLDEASLGWALLLVQEFLKVIGHVNVKGVTILLAEQNVNHALTLVAHAYVLENRRLAIQGKGSNRLNDHHMEKAY